MHAAHYQVAPRHTLVAPAISADQRVAAAERAASATWLGLSAWPEVPGTSRASEGGVLISPAPPSSRRIVLGGAPCDLMSESEAVSRLVRRAADPMKSSLGVASVNLDHVHHFGRGGRYEGALERPVRGLNWLNLLDGSPLVSAANRLTGQEWPKLAGSDLSLPILDACASKRLRVAFLGGGSDTQEALNAKLTREWPNIEFAGHWTPSRDVIADEGRSSLLAREIRAAQVQILFVCLGKPRQELWIARHGVTTGAGALLAFGATVDFLAGRVSRAPKWVSEHGLEWAYRLAQEPRRLANRYLVQGPPAYLTVRRASAVEPSTQSSLLEQAA